MSTSFYSEEELKDLGLKKYGNNVLISRKASLYSPEKIQIGNNVRIDDFCILSGNIILGSNIHISAYVAIYGTFGVIMEDYTGISARCTVYSDMDDFGGNYLIGPVHSDKHTNVTGGKVILNKFSQIGCNCVIFPNVTIGEGTVVGSMSLVNKPLDDWGIYAGIPVKRIKDRQKGLLKYVDSL